MLLFPQSSQVGFTSSRKLKYNKEELYKCSWSPIQCYRHSCWYRLTSLYNEISSKSALKTYFCDNQKSFFHPVIANFSDSNWQILVFLSCPEVSGNQQKPKINYMVADGHNRKSLVCYWNIFLMIFFSKIQHKILQLEIQFTSFHPLGVETVKKSGQEVQKTKLKLE